jgi:DNA replication protein DnaC
MSRDTQIIDEDYSGYADPLGLMPGIIAQQRRESSRGELSESEYTAQLDEQNSNLFFRQALPVNEELQQAVESEAQEKKRCTESGREYVEDYWIKHRRFQAIEENAISLERIAKRQESFPIRHRDNLKKVLAGNHPAWRGKLDSIIQSLGNGSIFVFHGSRGTGKTQLATAISRYLAEVKKQQSCYTVLGDLFTKIKGTFKSESSESEDEIITQLAYAPLLALDECHEMTGTEWQCRILTLLIDTRYRSKLDTIMITNQSQEGFIASVGESIADRIAEVGYFVECDWTSFRRARL